MSNAILTRRATAKAPTSTWDSDNRTFEAVVSRFADVPRYSFTERLSSKAADWNFSRVASPAGVPFLDNHRVYGDGGGKLGRVISMRVADGAVVAKIKLGRSEAAEKIVRDIEDGIGCAISFQYRVGAWEILPRNGGTPEIRIARQIEVLEVSAVNVAADPAAHVRNLPKGNTMDKEDIDTIETGGEDPDTLALAAERRRAADISGMASRHSMPAGFADEHIRKGTSLDQVRVLVLNHVTSESEKTRISPRTHYGDHNEQTRDNPDALGRAISEAIYGQMAGKRMDGLAGDMQAGTMMDMGRALVEARGERPAWSRHALAGQIMKRSPGYHSTSDFPTLLASAGERRMLDSYQAAASPLKTLAKRYSATDFRAIATIRLSEAPELLKIGEGGEVKYGTRAESKESFKVETFGRNFGLTREALINDDLGAFADSAVFYGTAGAEREANQLAALLTANSGNGINLDDGNPIFTTGRGNKAGAGTVIDVTNLGAARKAMRETKGLDGKTVINAVPKYLLVGAAKETEAEQVLAALTATVVEEQNPFSGKLQLLVEPRLAGNAWRVFADPANAPVLAYAYLNGNEGPMLEEFREADTLGVVFRVILDFGAGAIGWRGSWLNPGN
jgi:hypothetical protein